LNIRIIAVGKLKEKYLKQGIEEYAKRLSRYCKVEILELEDEKAPENLSLAEEALVKQKEGERIEKALRQGAFSIALAIDGERLTSEEFAKKLSDLALKGVSFIDFIIGGSLGLDQRILAKADMKLSFSTFTFPHQLCRLILLEQIYRAFRINRGETYHK